MRSSQIRIEVRVCESPWSGIRGLLRGAYAACANGLGTFLTLVGSEAAACSGLPGKALRRKRKQMLFRLFTNKENVVTDS